MFLKILLVSAVLLIALSGCGGKDYTTYATSSQSLAASNAQLALSYSTTRAQVDALVIQSLSAKGESVGIALYGIMAAERDAATLKMLKSTPIKAPKTPLDLADTALKVLGKPAVDALMLSTMGNYGAAAITLGDGATYIEAGTSASAVTVDGNDNHTGLSSATTTTTTNTNQVINDSSDINLNGGASSPSGFNRDDSAHTTDTDDLPSFSNF